MSAIDLPPAPVPAHPSLKSLREAIPDCRACDLWESARQALMGEGAAHARLMLVGEQPGDREDLEGHPFVGPAGRVLDDGLVRAGIARDEVYITNAVKHFRYKLRGKRRIHQKPDPPSVVTRNGYCGRRLCPVAAPALKAALRSPALPGPGWPRAPGPPRCYSSTAR
jgi:uracil-DNA glycosylase